LLPHTYRTLTKKKSNPHKKDQNDNQKNLLRRLLRDKQFGDRGGMPSKFKWSHSCQIPQKINQGKEV
jgi:hypothetical protein